MRSASELISKYGIGKTNFYQRRDLLIRLGYDMQPDKQGRNSFYSDEQVNLFDELDAHITEKGTTQGFKTVNALPNVEEHQVIILTDQLQDNQQNGNINGQVNSDGELDNQQVHSSSPESSTLVHSDSQSGGELVVTPDEDNGNDDEVVIVDNSEQNFQTLDTTAQYAAAGELAAFNYLKEFYLKTRNFTVDGLSQEVEKSEAAVNQYFEQQQITPDKLVKKMMQRVKQRDKPQ